MRIDLKSQTRWLIGVFVGVSIVIPIHGGLDWEDCGTKVNVTDLRISGCTKQPCIFNNGEEYSLEFDAISSHSSRTLPYSVTANNLFQFDISEGDACSQLSHGSCPILSQGQFLTFAKKFLIELPFPAPSTFPATVVAQMDDDTGEKILCAKMQVEIKSKPSLFGILDFWI